MHHSSPPTLTSHTNVALRPPVVCVSGFAVLELRAVVLHCPVSSPVNLVEGPVEVAVESSGAPVPDHLVLCPVLGGARWLAHLLAPVLLRLRTRYLHLLRRLLQSLPLLQHPGLVLGVLPAG